MIKIPLSRPIIKYTDTMIIVTLVLSVLYHWGVRNRAWFWPCHTLTQPPQLSKPVHPLLHCCSHLCLTQFVLLIFLICLFAYVVSTGYFPLSYQRGSRRSTGKAIRKTSLIWAHSIALKTKISS